MSCLHKLPSPLSCPLSSSCYPRTHPPFSTTVRIVFKCSQQHSDIPFNNSCPTILFYTASTAGFRRYIVCIPIYPYSLISILFFSISVHSQFHIFVDNIPLTPSLVSLGFYHVFISIGFLVFFLYFTQGFSSAPHLHKRSFFDDTTRRPRGHARTLSLGLTLPLLLSSASNSTDCTLVPLTWPLRAFSTCFPARPSAAHKCAHPRDGRHTGIGWFGRYLEVLRNRDTAESYTGSLLSCC